MSIPVVILYLLFAIYLVAQFGRSISPSRAASWWLLLLFIFAVITRPDEFGALAKLIGVQLVSNLVFAGLILFLIQQSLSHAATVTQLSRRMRGLVSATAAVDHPAAAPPAEPGVTKALIVLPTYNERESLPAMLSELDALLARDEAGLRFGVCFVDDGSLDGSLEIITAGHPTWATRHRVNQGVAGVLLTGFMVAERAGYDVVVQCDADGQHPVARIPDLVRESRRRDVDLLIGSRFAGGVPADGSSLESTTVLRRAGGFLISCVLMLFGTRARVSDPTSGFRVYSREAVRVLKTEMPDEYPEPENIAIIAARGLSVAEMPMRMRAREAGASSISGWVSVRYMVKVITALVALRLRLLLR